MITNLINSTFKKILIKFGVNNNYNVCFVAPANGWIWMLV